MAQLVLSLFPGMDLFGMAFEMEGFVVVKGPDILMGGDIRKWHSLEGKFDGIIGGPPCKSFSKAISGAGGSEFATQGNLIPEFERIVEESKPKWYVMENVKAAPIPFYNTEVDFIFRCQSYNLLDAWECGSSQHRIRRFSSNLWLKPKPISVSERHPDPWPTVTATEYKMSAGSNERAQRQRAGRKVGRKMTLQEVNEAMGLPSDFETPALTNAMSYQVRGNGVPIPLGRTIARAVKEALIQG
ncbi:MAG TPA: DNA cytosine methyltransferase [Nitrosopumilaceae archaeon]|jgi:DNA (cytosine-5)-methyltransferase 1|nr:DNA cytosine methyltransferase [Nitrosopumilaceae archaeon]